MKNTLVLIGSGTLSAIAIVCTALFFAGTAQAQAENNRYQSSSDGYRDQHGHYHAYDYYNNHRGYWHQNNGIRVWINLG
jgi:hypothetical protein